MDNLVGTRILPYEHVSQVRIVGVRGVERIDELVQLVLELVRHSGIMEILVAEIEDDSASLLVDNELLDLRVRGKTEADLPRAVVHAEAQVFGGVPVEEVVEHLPCGEGVLAILPDMDAVEEIVERHHGCVAELELVELVLDHSDHVRRIVVELADVERAVHEEAVRFVHPHIEEWQDISILDRHEALGESRFSYSVHDIGAGVEEEHGRPKSIRLVQSPHHQIPIGVPGDDPRVRRAGILHEFRVVLVVYEPGEIVDVVIIGFRLD